MSAGAEAWAAALELTPEQASEFKRLAGELEATPVEILRTMVDRVIRMDLELRRYGSPGLGHWVSGKERVEIAAEYGIDALPLDIRPTGFMWPADKPLPWTAEECRAAPAIAQRLRVDRLRGQVAGRLR